MYTNNLASASSGIYFKFSQFTSKQVVMVGLRERDRAKASSLPVAYSSDLHQESLELKLLIHSMKLDDPLEV